MVKDLLHAPSSSLFQKSLAVYAQQHGLLPADRIKEPIFQTGITKHHSIYLGMDESGNEWISENHKFHGVRLVKASDFFKSARSYAVEPFTGSYPERMEAVRRALTLLKKPYDLFSYNCEHYASYVQTGNAISYQVENVMGALKFLSAAAFFIGVITLITND